MADQEQTEGITQQEQIAAYSSVYSVKWHYIGDTSKQSAGRRFRGENDQAIREAVQFGPTTLEELSIPKSDVIAPETPVSTSIVNEGLPPNTQPHPALTVKPMCTCGTLVNCIAHD